MKPLLRGCLPLCLAMACLLVAVQPALAQQGGNPAGLGFGTGTGLIFAGLGLIMVGLCLTGGVIYLAFQGQNNTYAGGSGRKARRKRRDADD